MSAIEKALAMIKREEGLELRAYPDPASGGDPWTIGYGATGPDIREGTVWTREQCESDLEGRVQLLAQQVADEIEVEWTDNQLAALISFAYNVGIGRDDDPDTPENEGRGLRGSTLMRKLNAGDPQGAADQFRAWTKAAGKVNKGLVARRERERKLFLTPDA